MKKVIIIMAALLSFAAVPASKAAQNWAIGAKYSVKFACDGSGGIFKTMTGAIAFDDKDLATSSFNMSIDVASINTGNAMMNKHAKGDDWFDAAKYPSIKFTSKKIAKAGAGYQVTGDLEMHGVKMEVTIPFTFAANTFSGKFSVNRSDFKIGKPGGEVGEVIKLDVTVPVTKK